MWEGSALPFLLRSDFMKFFGTPGLLVRVRSTKPIRFFRFDENGVFETNNQRLIRRLKARFRYEEEGNAVQKSAEEKASANIFICKKCGYEAENRGKLLAHCRTAHKKE